jgi:hypothetical protein
LKNYQIYYTLLFLLVLAGCDNGENKRLKAELAALKDSVAEKKTIVQGPVNEYGVKPGLPSVRILLAKSELKDILIKEEGVSQKDAAKVLESLSYVAGSLMGAPRIGLDKGVFDASIKSVNQLKEDVDLGVNEQAYADRYYSRDYSYIVIDLATALLKEGLIINEAADTSSGCVIKAKSPKRFFSLPQEFIFLVQPSEHGIRVFGASTTKHKFYSLDKPERSLNQILDKVG